METANITARRTVARVEDKVHLGGDAQVDDRNVVITPMHPAATDPFLLLSEDWFSTRGFEWHPHRLLAAERPVVQRVGARIEPISGDVDGARGPALNNWPIWAALITLEPNRSIEHLLPGGHRAFFYVLSGEVTIAGRRAATGQIAWSNPYPGAAASAITLATVDGNEPSVVMACSGQPIGEPVVMGGPFVMNSKAEIKQAFRDFHFGRFGAIPRQARLQYR